jgi:hypothetical protein
MEFEVSTQPPKQLSDPRPKVTKIALLGRGSGHVVI